MGDEQDRQEVREEVKSRVRLLYDFTWQMASFGPVLATKMSIYSTISLPWGLGAAGAETVKQGVDSGNSEGVGRMTAIMVKLGMLGTVHDIVVSLCAQDRADAVASVTAALLCQAEVWTVIQITNALVASNHAGEAVDISLSLIQQGNVEILTVVKEVGLDINLPGCSNDSKDGEDKHTSPGILESIQQTTAQALEKITPGTSTEEAEKKQTPDADALFSEWTGVKPEEAGGSRGENPTDDDEAVAPKKERLL